MNRFTLLVSMVIVAGCARGQFTAANDTQDKGSFSAAFANSAGEWVVESSTGAQGTGQVFVDMIGTVITLSDDRISWVEKWGVDAKGKSNWMRVSRKLVAKPDVSPDAVDLDADGPYKAWERVAILRVDGEEMQLCVNFPQGPRPTKFQKADDGSEFVVLRRVKPADRK